jgi:hypothetical protein
LELDHDNGTVRVDWHQYAADQVETWADKVVEAAYVHGFSYVEFVHGAGDVVARGMPGYDGSVAGRGRIKEILRQRLFRGRWSRWARPRREGRHRVEETRIVIALRDNPSPRPQARWPLLPPPAHS